MSASRLRCGAVRAQHDEVRWCLWAPKATQVELLLMDMDGERRHIIPMRAECHGYFTAQQAGIPEGQRYGYRLDQGEERPDPCSLWQPDGIPGPSAVYSPGRFTWHDQQWMGVHRKDLVIYELHVGTFTPEGTFDAIIRRLQSLKELGVTALEVMPVAQFPGNRNWGYDGLLPYAAQNTYGGPMGLQRLVDAAHEVGLAVLLDVVYNHLGPEGSYVQEFGPFYTDEYKTPWGQAINYDQRGCDGVRTWVLDNARMWLEEFHLDGLRLDAVHAIYDLGARHILREISETAAAVADEAERRIHIIAESDLNDPRIILPAEHGGHAVSAQWADDFHHAVHATLTGERRGYYSDFTHPQQLARALATPFVFAGEYSQSRGRRHGAPLPPEIPGDQFIVCIQNHDQVGNRAKGDRLSTLLNSWPKQRLAASILLLSPYLPMLFMGEEYGEERPFPFFCSFCGEQLLQAVRDGRQREFADFVDSPEEIPDPSSEQTFRSGVLTWSWPDGSFHSAIRRLYGDLLRARRNWPAMGNMSERSCRLFGEQPNAVVELVRGGMMPEPERTLQVYMNLAAMAQPIPVRQHPSDRPLFSSELSRYCGTRANLSAIDQLLPYECVAFGPAAWPVAGA